MITIPQRYTHALFKLKTSKVNAILIFVAICFGRERMLHKILQSFKSDPEQDYSNFEGDLTGGLRKEDQTGGFWNPDMTGGFWNPDMTDGYWKEKVREDYMDCKEGGTNCREGGTDCINNAAAIAARRQGGR